MFVNFPSHSFRAAFLLPYQVTKHPIPFLNDLCGSSVKPELGHFDIFTPSIRAEPIDENSLSEISVSDYGTKNSENNLAGELKLIGTDNATTDNLKARKHTSKRIINEYMEAKDSTKLKT